MSVNGNQTAKLAILVVLFASSILPVSATVHFPQGKTVTVPADKTVHFLGPYIQASDSPLHISSWPTDSDWLNWTQDIEVSQSFYFGSEPTLVVIDGSVRSLGNGWNYSNGLIAVDALNAVSMSWTLSPYVPPVIPPPFEGFIIPTGGINLTWFLRGEVQTSRNTTGYALGIDETHVPVQDSIYTSGNVSASYGVRVWVVVADGSLRELTPDAPALLVTRTVDGEGLSTGYWNCTGYNGLVDSMIIKVYQSFSGSGWSLRSTFVSNENLLIKLPESTWSFNLYTNRTVLGSSTWSDLSWGCNPAGYLSTVGFYYLQPSAYEIQMFRLEQGDFVGFVVAPFTVLGINVCYLMLVLIMGVTFYIRQESIVPVAIIFMLFGGAGGVILNLLPTATYQLAYLFFAFAVAILLFKLVKGKDYGE